MHCGLWQARHIIWSAVRDSYHVDWSWSQRHLKWRGSRVKTMPVFISESHPKYYWIRELFSSLLSHGLNLCHGHSSFPNCTEQHSLIGIFFLGLLINSRVSLIQSSSAAPAQTKRPKPTFCLRQPRSPAPRRPLIAMTTPVQKIITWWVYLLIILKSFMSSQTHLTWLTAHNTYCEVGWQKQMFL